MLVFLPYSMNSTANSGDIDSVNKIQAGYKAQRLSAFLGQPAPKAAPPIDFFKPLTQEQQKTYSAFWCNNHTQ
jgi:hypothetical protein